MLDSHSGCYFWIDTRIPEDVRTISVLCEKCHDEKYPDVEGYWDFANGIGPWDIVCNECGETLYKHVSKTEKELEELEQDLDNVLEQAFGGQDGE